jgi:fucose 4-O-acetylase-like acetyltransferase
MFKRSTVALSADAAMSERYGWVDYARGIAIMLVVYRHVLIGMQRADIFLPHAAFEFQELFYNFRMPVFFVLSGVFLAKSLRKKSWISVLQDRSATLLYPYLLWGSVLITLQIVFSRYTNATREISDYLYLFSQPRRIDHLWYLFALFNTSMLFLFVTRFVKNKQANVVFAVCLHALTITPLFEGNSLIGDICYFYLYLVCGTYFSEMLLSPSPVIRVSNPVSAFLMLLFFIVAQWFWFMHADEENLYLPLFLLINLFACWCVYVLSVFLARFEATGWLSFIGEHSLYIYILHVTIAALIRSILVRSAIAFPPVVILISCWIAGVVVPIVLFQTLKRYGFKRMFSLKQNSAG